MTRGRRMCRRPPPLASSPWLRGLPTPAPCPLRAMFAAGAQLPPVRPRCLVLPPPPRSPSLRARAMAALCLRWAASYAGEQKTQGRASCPPPPPVLRSPWRLAATTPAACPQRVWRLAGARTVMGRRRCQRMLQLCRWRWRSDCLTPVPSRWLASCAAGEGEPAVRPPHSPPMRSWWLLARATPAPCPPSAPSAVSARKGTPTLGRRQCPTPR